MNPATLRAFPSSQWWVFCRAANCPLTFPRSCLRRAAPRGILILIKDTGSFGIRVLDERLSGPVQGGLHALIGGPGTGKTVAALQFLREGIRQDGRVALLTQARPEDVIELAHSIGIDLTTHLRSGRWLMLGYQPGFRDRYRRTIEPKDVFEELQAFLGEDASLARLAIDTCGPLVDPRESGTGAELLVELLNVVNSTVLLTFAGESPAALDSAFDFVSQRASLILHMTMSSSGRRQIVVRKTQGRHEAAGSISFDIRDGVGIVLPEMTRQERSSDLKPEVRRRVLLLDVTGELAEELRLWFEGSFELFHTSDAVDAFPELARKEFGLVAVHVDRRSVERGLHVMQQLRRAAGRPPILVMCPYDLRASDRAHALRVGADDFISGGLNPDELASRIDALLRRGRTTASDDEEAELQKKPKFQAAGTEPEHVREIVRSRLDDPFGLIFSLILIRPSNGTKVDVLASHVADQMRQDTGDRLSIHSGRVEVFLDGAMGTHADRFLSRVRTDEWEKKIAAVVYTSPTDRDELIRVIEEDD